MSYHHQGTAEWAQREPIPVSEFSPHRSRNCRIADNWLTSGPLHAFALALRIRRPWLAARSQGRPSDKALKSKPAGVRNGSRISEFDVSRSGTEPWFAAEFRVLTTGGEQFYGVSVQRLEVPNHCRCGVLLLLRRRSALGQPMSCQPVTRTSHDASRPFDLGTRKE